MIKRIILISLLLSLLLATPAAAATSAVVGTGTPASCTEKALKDALVNNKVITFNCGANPVTIPLTSEITISADHIIYGGGKITLDGQLSTRIFHVIPYRALMLDGMTLKNGKVSNTASDPIGKGQGAAIFVDIWSDLTVQNVVFQNNQASSNVQCSGGGAIRLNGFNIGEVFDSTFINNTAPNGGAISNLTADLTVRNSLFDSNQATFDNTVIPVDRGCYGGGGAIFIDGASPPNQGGAATIQITNSIFRNNKTWQSGGAIFSYLYSYDVLSIDRSVIEGNQALFTQKADGSVPPGAGMGGALYLNGELNEAARLFKGKYIVTNSTLSGNHADAIGGAIEVGSESLLLTNVTIANNEATNSKSNLPSSFYRGSGGAMWIALNSSTTVNSLFKNVTIANNSAGNYGGGIAGDISKNPNATKLQNSIVANNTAAGSSSNCRVTLVNLGGNVQYPAPSGGNVNCSSNITTGAVNLGALGNYGGPTKTVPPQAGSAAINHGVTGCPPTDQRGYGRNGVCDSGAFEYNGLALDHKTYIPLVSR